MKKQAFSSEQYLNLQRDHILERINQFDGSSLSNQRISDGYGSHHFS
ncbi:ATP-dependent Zn protease [Streptococcus pneumoniae]|nr:ATP-dependent Zn protease [Streptococcus pneumoniae]